MEATDLPLDELKQVTLAKVQELVTDQSKGSTPRYTNFDNFGFIYYSLVSVEYTWKLYMSDQQKCQVSVYLTLKFLAHVLQFC